MENSIIIRKATAADLDAVTHIYDRIHAEEDAGRTSIGWITGVYPVRATAEQSLEEDCLYVMEDGGRTVATARINHAEDPAYAGADWQIPAKGKELLVIHTLIVSPDAPKKGYGSLFLAYYEDLARSLGCLSLRLDTNARNTRARAFYARHGYREAGIVPCEFNGIPGVNLVCLEKKVEK